MFVERRLKAISKGWKPGAVSKCMLRKLRRAKLMSAAVMDSAPLKKSKKKCGDKPTLIISKTKGEYTVEMQVTSEKDHNCIQHDPLIYKIASADNEEKIKRREKKAKRLISNMIKEFDDPFHPAVCQDTCLSSYKQAVGVLDDIPGDQGSSNVLISGYCSCEEDEESDASSLDLDWEIHYSPPIDRVES